MSDPLTNAAFSREHAAFSREHAAFSRKHAAFSRERGRWELPARRLPNG